MIPTQPNMAQSKNTVELNSEWVHILSGDEVTCRQIGTYEQVAQYKPRQNDPTHLAAFTQRVKGKEYYTRRDSSNMELIQHSNGTFTPKYPSVWRRIK